MTSLLTERLSSSTNYYSQVRILRNGIVVSRHFRNDSETAMKEVAGVKKWIPALGWGLCITALVTMTTGAVLQNLRGGGDNAESLIEHIGLMVGFASFPVLGALIASRAPKNPLGWIFLGVGCCIGILLGATEYAYLAYVGDGTVDRNTVLDPAGPGGWDLPFPIVAIWLEQWLWYPALGLVAPFTLLLFPDGKPAGRFWRVVAWVGGISLAVIAVGAGLEETFEAEAGYIVRNPVGLGFENVEQAMGQVFAVFGGCAVLGAVSLVVRFWRSTGDERQQLKLLTMAAVVVVGMSAAGDLLQLPGFIFPLVLWMIPGAVAVAIFRHRLYDIDTVINRTLVYGVLTAILVGAYLGIVFVLQEALTGLTRESDIAVAGSTLAVAAMFRPVRNRVQGFIDRRFNRNKYDAQLTLENFSSRLRDDVDLQHLARDLETVVRDTMQPAHVSVWLRSPDQVEASS